MGGCYVTIVIELRDVATASRDFCSSGLWAPLLRLCTLDRVVFISSLPHREGIFRPSVSLGSFSLKYPHLLTNPYQPQFSPTPSSPLSPTLLIAMSHSAPSSSTPSKPTPYVCDTIPAARLASFNSYPRSPSPQPIPTPPVTAFKAPIIDETSLAMDVGLLDRDQASVPPPDSPPAPPPRKLCVRHQRMADEGTNLKLQQVRFLPLSISEYLGLFNPCPLHWLLLPPPSHIPQPFSLLGSIFTTRCISSPFIYLLTLPPLFSDLSNHLLSRRL